MQPTLMDPMVLDGMPAAPVPDADDGTPAAAMVDLLVDEMRRRVQLVAAAAANLPADAVTLDGALARMREAGVSVAALGPDPRCDAARLAQALRKLHRAVSVVEELVWVGLARELTKASAREDDS